MPKMGMPITEMPKMPNPPQSIGGQELSKMPKVEMTIVKG